MSGLSAEWVARARAVPIENEIARRGIKLRREGKEMVGPCPRCGGDDRFAINIKKQIFNCRGCGAAGDVIDLLIHLDGIDFKSAVELLTGKPAPKPPGNGKDHGAPEPRKVVAASFEYVDEFGNLLFVVERVEFQNPDGSFVLKDGKRKKTFRQKRPEPHSFDDEWIWNLDGVAIVPYRLPELTEAISNGQMIFIAEGERKVDELWAMNVPATCCAGDAKKWRAEHSEFLRGGAEVVILPDNDEPGRDHADIVGASLQGIASRVRLLTLPGLGSKEDIVDWIAAGGTREELDALVDQAPDWQPQSDRETTDEAGDQSSKEPPKVSWHGDVDYRTSRPQLVQDVIPQVGHGLISGQWGTFKTFGTLDLAHSVMSGEPFLGYQIMRSGGVLFVALEGGDEVPVRLQGVIDDRGKITGPAPFAWIDACPPLLAKNAADELCKTIEPIAKQFEERFGVPLVLIEIDTLIAGSGYSKDGQENDAAAGQAIMNTLKAVAKRMRCFVLGVDHFGKTVETGTRGTSAKEASADVVIAMLGDKSVSGEVTNTRLALRKRRGGPNGEEHPFTARKIDMGLDQFGKPMSTLVLDWGVAQAPAVAKDWTKVTRQLRKVLMTILADHGADHQPFADGPIVRACNLDLVRNEFYRQHPADGTEKQKTDARRQAFNRAFKAAQEGSLIATREIAGVQLVWLAKPDKA
ncbi:MAG TPA: AAA family ATPase [Xanthobacteraceae bacterium]|nr:AAA family ATPase [Xanthobacteraceae bacterium]